MYLLAACRCVLHRQRFSASVRQWQGWHKQLQQKFASSAGMDGPVSVLKRVYQTVLFLSLNQLEFLVHLFRVRLAWCTVCTYYSIICHIIIERLQVIWSSLSECIIFIYSVLLLVNGLINGMANIYYPCWRDGLHSLLLLILILHGKQLPV